MTISIWVLFGLLLAHFIGDFFLQSREMADNKSKCLKALMRHSMAYTIPFFVVVAIWDLQLWFIPVTMMLHFVVDGISSQFTSYYWSQKNTHGFFSVIGFDQMVHTVILVVTYNCFV